MSCSAELPTEAQAGYQDMVKEVGCATSARRLRRRSEPEATWKVSGKIEVCPRKRRKKDLPRFLLENPYREDRQGRNSTAWVIVLEDMVLIHSCRRRRGLEILLSHVLETPGPMYGKSTALPPLARESTHIWRTPALCVPRYTTFIDDPATTTMAIRPQSSLRKDKFRKRHHTLRKKAHEVAKICNAHVYVVVLFNGQFHVYKSHNHRGWPPTQDQIVSLGNAVVRQSRRIAKRDQDQSFPLPRETTAGQLNAAGA